MPANLSLSYYWPARWRPSGQISSTKVHRVSGNCRGGRNLFKWNGCSFDCPPPVTAETAAVVAADCFVLPRIDDSEQHAGAALGVPRRCSPLRQNAGESRWALTCDESIRSRRHAPVTFGLQAAMRMIRPMVAVWLRVALLLLLRSAPASAMVDLTLYGGVFDSSSIIAYAEV